MKKVLTIYIVIFVILSMGCNKRDFPDESTSNTSTNLTKESTSVTYIELTTGTTTSQNINSTPTSTTEQSSSLQIEETTTLDPKEAFLQNARLFTTEYTIEDYCQGCFIVSKNNGLLYGVLDRNGNELIPIKYDDIHFINDDNVRNKIMQQLYLNVKYKNHNFIFNSKGEKVLEEEINVIIYESNELYNKAPAFYSNNTNTHKIKIYDKYMQFITENNYSDCDAIDIKFLSDKYYLITSVKLTHDKYGNIKAASNVSLYTYTGETIKKWSNSDLGNVSYNKDIISLYILEESDLSYHLYNIDSNKKIEQINSLTFAEYKEFLLQNAKNTYSPVNAKKESYFLGNGVHLYKSNNTWKLFDINSRVPLYDERYYDCIEMNACYFLMNEDNRLCLINSNGKRVLDYDWLYYKNKKVYFNEKAISEDNIFPDDNGVYLIQDNQVYFFKNQE